jgi:hypothetical protein
MAGARWIVRRVAPTDAARVTAFLAQRDSRVVARLGVLVEADPLPKLAAVDGDEIVGVLAYRPADDGCEVVTLHAGASHQGIGTALLPAAGVQARQCISGRGRSGAGDHQAVDTDRRRARHRLA